MTIVPAPFVIGRRGARRPSGARRWRMLRNDHTTRLHARARSDSGSPPTMMRCRSRSRAGRIAACDCRVPYRTVPTSGDAARALLHAHGRPRSFAQAALDAPDRMHENPKGRLHAHNLHIPSRCRRAIDARRCGVRRRGGGGTRSAGAAQSTATHRRTAARRRSSRARAGGSARGAALHAIARRRSTRRLLLPVTRDAWTVPSFTILRFVAVDGVLQLRRLCRRKMRRQNRRSP